MITENIKNIIETPAHLFCEDKLFKLLSEAETLCANTGVKLLFPLKTLAVVEVLKYISKHVVGFSASSLFEAQLAKSIKKTGQTVHFTSPGAFKDVKNISQCCDYISCNSFLQLKEFSKYNPDTKLGLRINPQMSFVKDERFDPCCRHSKLGIPVDEISKLSENEVRDLKTKISGIHFHSNSEAESLLPLFQTVEKICRTIPDLIENMEWFNFGGGYFYDLDPENEQYLKQTVELVKSCGCKNVFIEPGTALCADAGCLVASVIDIFESEGKTIAVIDATVNHMPEVLEFNYSPEMLEAEEESSYSYIIAGGSCLAGDVWGEYSFKQKLEAGSKLTFMSTACYSIVKAHMFNGINLPSIYWLDSKNKVKLIKQYAYNDYLSRLE